MKNTRILTEGAMMLALYAVLLLITLYIPVLWIASRFFLILPFFIYSAKYPAKNSVMLIIAAIIISMITGNIAAVSIGFAYGTTGAAMGYFLYRKKGKFSVYMAGSLVFLANTIIQYVVAVLFFHFNFIDDSMKMLRESFERSVHMMDQLGEPVPDKAMEQFEFGMDYFRALVPSIFVVSSFVMVFLFTVIHFPILKRLGVEVPSWKPIREWQMPKSVLWYYIIVLIAAIIFVPENGSMWYMIYINLLFMLQICLTIQGISFLYFFGNLKNWPKAVPTALTVLSFLFFPVLYLVRILGIMDLGFDLKQRLQQKP
ncbi:YybS family protein [Bacillus smithii]|uniref:YybS family protein n=1 Tax=Bacillus smithii TaxID=1479 RepID=UPI003D203509